MPQTSYFFLFARDLHAVVEEAKAHQGRVGSMPIESAGYAYIMNVLTKVRGSMYDPLTAANKKPHDPEVDAAGFRAAREVLDREGHEVVSHQQRAKAGKFGADEQACQQALHYLARIREALDRHNRAREQEADRGL